jgi:hypothetical protein
MNIGIDIGLLTVAITVLGMLLKSIGEMKKEVRESTAFIVATKKDLEHISYRLQVVEHLQREMDDMRRYMTNNSDWTVLP